MEDFLTSTLKSLAIRLPFLLVCVAGLVLIGLRWNRHPRTSLLAFLGTAVLLVSSLVTSVIYDLISRMMNRFEWSFEHASTIFTTTSFVFFVFDALGVGLLLVAILRQHGART